MNLRLIFYDKMRIHVCTCVLVFSFSCFATKFFVFRNSPIPDQVRVLSSVFFQLNVSFSHENGNS